MVRANSSTARAASSALRVVSSEAIDTVMAFRRRDAELIGIAKQGGGFLIQRVNQVGDFGREAVDQAFRLAGPARSRGQPVLPGRHGTAQVGRIGLGGGAPSLRLGKGGVE